MKKYFSIYFLAALVAGNFSSCSEYEGPTCPSIFEIKPDTIDLTAYSAPLDSFCKKNFLETYNVDFKYKMEDIASDVNKNLTPAYYNKCEEMAILTKYLWYDVYKNFVGETLEDGQEFLKRNSPRIIHLIGSKNMNPVQGTENLGTASGGIKITFYRTNTLDISNLDYCNKMFFGTMHHEFGHLLCSRYVVPLEYRQLSAGFYDPLGWQNTCDSVALGDGFVSDYARNYYEDDFVEMIAKYVTSTPAQWQKRLDIAKYQWEEVSYDKSSSGYDEITRILRRGGNIDSIGYKKPLSPDEADRKITIIRKMIKREIVDDKNAYAYPIMDADGNRVIEYVLKDEGKTGTDLINKKLDLLTTWLKDNYKIDINKIRQAVLTRSYITDDEGNLVLNGNGQPINRIVQPYQGYPTLLDYLVQNMRQYKTIDTFDFIK